MHLKCSKCSQPIALTDIIESIDGRLSHMDCARPSTLTPAERALVFIYCSDHAVAECVTCNASYRFARLGTDPISGRTNVCPRCRKDLTDGIRAHLYACAMAPAEIRHRAQEVREAALILVKQAQQLRDVSDVLIRHAEAALFDRQQRLRDAMANRAIS